MAPKVNVYRHAGHPMPKSPTLAPCIGWHGAHASARACRGISASVVPALKRRRLRIPDTSDEQELYGSLSNAVARQLKRRKVTEDDLLKDFRASQVSAANFRMILVVVQTA